MLFGILTFFLLTRSAKSVKVTFNEKLKKDIAGRIVVVLKISNKTEPTVDYLSVKLVWRAISVHRFGPYLTISTNI